MEKMSGESMNLLNENIEKLKALFPEIVTDGKIDFDMLKTLLGEEVDASNEKYSFNWVGKRNCIKFAQTPSTGTLIPCKEKSVDFDNTQNIYIEGDNVEALKLLQKTYFGKIKMIYIDPPYNTGNDFVYHDDYKDSIENYKKITGQQATANPETNGRFHTDWLNMMYPRLKLAKDLLTDDGVILISINSYEAENLGKMCNEIFGESNCICRFGWETKKAAQGMTTENMVVDNQESIYVYAKNKTLFKFRGLDRDEENGFSNPDNDPRGLWKRQYLQRLGQGLPTRTIVDPQNGNVFSFETPYTQDKLNRWIKENRIIFPTDPSKYPVRKEFLNEYENHQQLVTSLGLYATKATTEKLYNIFGGEKIFTNPKPDTLIHFLVQQCAQKGTETILDFFSGSATTAHAVMQLNAEDGGNRKFIMVQLPELCDEKSEAYKAGYKTICDIGEERIRRAGAKIKEENPLTTLNLDTGFKVFRLDSTNIVPWNNAEKLDEMRLYDYAKTIKDGRDDLSVAYEIMLKYGVFDKPMKETVVSGKKMYDVGEGYMIICLADGVTMTDVEAIARLNPHCVVFKESGFADDNEKINATHTLERGGVEKILCI